MTTEETGEEVDDFEDLIYAKRQKITNVEGKIVKCLEVNWPIGMWILWDISAVDRRIFPVEEWWRGPF